MIAYSPHQTAIAAHHPQNPIAFSLKSNSDRPSSPTKRDRLDLKIKQRSPLTTHKPDRLLSQPQTAIAPSSPTKPDRLNLKIKQRSPLVTHKHDRLFPTSNSQAIFKLLSGKIHMIYVSSHPR